MSTFRDCLQNTIIVTNRGFLDKKYNAVNFYPAPNILKGVNSKYIFFPFWSEKIPPEIYETYECVMFHTSDLPFGRGGSPIQNLIKRGINETQVTAFKCTGEMDAGPIYCKQKVSLHGTAEEIFLRIEKIIEEMICHIIENNPVPKEQAGDAYTFKRLGEHDLSELSTLDEAFDHIRMVDAKGYPKAFVEIGEFRFEFSRASLKRDHVIADVKIRRKNE